MVLVTIGRTFVWASRLQVSCLSNHIVEWWYLMGQDKTQCNQYKYKTNSERQTADSCCTRYSFQSSKLIRCFKDFCGMVKIFPNGLEVVSVNEFIIGNSNQVTPRPVKLGWRAHPTAGIGSPPRFGCIWSWNGKQMQTVRAPCMNLQARNWTMINFDKRCFAALNQWTLIHHTQTKCKHAWLNIYIYIYCRTET